VFDQLAAALRRAIERGQLPPGSRLPPERLLGSYLGVGRRTVARAYRSLEALGLVERLQGRGTTVRGLEAPRWDDRTAKLTTALQRNIVFRSLAHEPAPTVDLLSVYSPPSDRLVAELMQCVASLLGGELTVHHHGYMPARYPPLRAAIAQRYTDTGIPTVEEEVLVTSGAQQGISLVASAFVKPEQLGTENSAPRRRRFGPSEEPPSGPRVKLVDAEWTRYPFRPTPLRNAKPLETAGKPSVGLEPTTPSLPWASAAPRKPSRFQVVSGTT
jgi:DNA-binding transcriptional MocR family regulator